MKFIDNNATRLLDELETHLSQSEEICIAVAFVRLSGVSLLRGSLRQALERGVSVHLLFGLDFALSEARAVNDLIALGVDARAYSSRESFHPKGYVFRIEGRFIAIVGSSNLSASGLTSGREWNVLVEDANPVMSEFIRLWESREAVPVTAGVLERLERKPPDELRDEIEREDRIETVAPVEVAESPIVQLGTRSEPTPELSFLFNINGSFKKYGQLTVPSSQVSYQRLIDAGFGSGHLTIAFENQSRLVGFMHSAKAGFGLYYQIRIAGPLIHPLFDLPIGTRVVVSLAREGEGNNVVQIARG